MMLVIGALLAATLPYGSALSAPEPRPGVDIGPWEPRSFVGRRRSRKAPDPEREARAQAKRDRRAAIRLVRGEE